MRNLNNEVIKCENNLERIGIHCGRIRDISVNTRAKKRWGRTTRINNCGQYEFKIEINKTLLEDSTPIEALHTTIYHELLHTVNGCFNHGENWKAVANKVNKAYGVNIKRCTSYEEKGIDSSIAPQKHYNHMLKCTKCGQEYKYQRAGKAIMNYHNYRCGECHSELEYFSLFD